MKMHRIIYTVLGIVILAAFFALFAYSRHPTDAQFTRIAHDYVAAKYSWADTASYRVERTGDYWYVTVHPPTRTREGLSMLSITIDRKGKIVGMMSP
jgi:hypothetical protein